MDAARDTVYRPIYSGESIEIEMASEQRNETWKAKFGVLKKIDSGGWGS